MSTSEVQIGKELYEFGRFRADPARRLLLRDGDAIALTPKAFQLLLTFLSRPNELVTKDELMKAVWPETFVEETNLSRNIFDLRKALGETGQNRIIITVPGRGYRFAADVRLISEPDRTIVAATRSKLQVQISETKPWAWIAIALAVMLLFATALTHLAPRRSALTEKDTVVVADFSNFTSDPVFDGTLRQGLEVQLEQSPFLSLVPEPRIRRTLAMMGRPADSKLVGETAREVCQRTGGTAVIDGSISALGTQYVLGLRARNCSTGNVLAEEQEQLARKEDVLNALSQIAIKFRTRLGESLSTVKEYSTPLAEATTPSLEALQAYTAGWQVHSLHGASAALPFFRKATDIDPRFAMAQASLGRIYADLDQLGLAADRITRAWQFRDRASEREKFFITSAYQTLVTGNLEVAQQTCEAWARAYPREALAHTMLAGIIHKRAGRYEQALVEAHKVIELSPDFWHGYYSQGVLNIYLGNMNEGESALRAAAARGLDADEFIMLAYDIDFLKGDRAGMEREAARARARPGGDNWISARESSVAAYSGHLHDARVITRRALAEAQQAGQPERAALWAAGAAVRESLLGDRKAAFEFARNALQLSHEREVQYGSALAFALAGETSRAQTLADDLEKQFPEDSSVRFNYLPTIRAVIALDRKAPQGAVELLQVAAPDELGIPLSAISGLFGALYPVYFRGQAYLAANKPLEAAAEFEKIIKHQGIVVSDPIAILAHLQLARAYASSGSLDNAKSEYGTFLAIWKDADRDLSILKQAEAEYAKL